MSVTSGFFDSKNRDRLYNTKQLTSIFDGIINDGVYMGYKQALMVKAENPASLTILVSAGRAWFDHTWTENDTVLPIEIDPGDVILNRIDAIVIDVNRTLDVRANSIMVVRGTPASSPSRPTLIKQDDHKQYPLCYISIPAGSKAITQSQITNTIGTSECPFVTGIIETIDVDDLLAQWEAQYREWFEQSQDNLETWMNEQKAEFEEWTEGQKESFKEWKNEQTSDFIDWSNSKKEEFLSWFSSLEATLDENVAGNLQNQINHKTGINATAIYAEGEVAITAPEDSGEILTFIAPSDFLSTDTYSLNGVLIPLTDLIGFPLGYSWKKGSPVTITISDGKAFFKTGGVNSTLPDLLPNFIADWEDEETIIVLADMVSEEENPDLSSSKWAYSENGEDYPNDFHDGVLLEISKDEMVY